MSKYRLKGLDGWMLLFFIGVIAGNIIYGVFSFEDLKTAYIQLPIAVFLFLGAYYVFLVAFIIRMLVAIKTYEENAVFLAKAYCILAILSGILGWIVGDTLNPTTPIIGAIWLAYWFKSKRVANTWPAKKRKTHLFEKILFTVLLLMTICIMVLSTISHHYQHQVEEIMWKEQHDFDAKLSQSIDQNKLTFGQILNYDKGYSLIPPKDYYLIENVTTQGMPFDYIMLHYSDNDYPSSISILLFENNEYSFSDYGSQFVKSLQTEEIKVVNITNIETEKGIKGKSMEGIFEQEGVTLYTKWVLLEKNKRIILLVFSSPWVASEERFRFNSMLDRIEFLR